MDGKTGHMIQPKSFNQKNNEILQKKNHELTADESYLLGIFNYNLSFYDEAIDYLRKSNQLGFTVTESEKLIDLCESKINELLKIEEKTYSNGVFCHKKNTSSAYEALGNIESLLAMNNIPRIKDSIYFYNKAITIDESNANLYNKRADSKVILGLYQDAIDDYNHSLKLNPDNTYASYCIKIMSAINGEFTKSKIKKESYKVMKSDDFLPDFINNDTFKILLNAELSAE